MWLKMNERKLHSIIKEELTNSQVESMINSKLSSALKSTDFKKAVKELSADVVSEVFKILWQRNNMWMDSAKRV